MASQAGVQLFLQRILTEKYLQDDTVDRLIRSISRGTGHDFGGKNGFVQEANRVLSDIGYMLVRVSVNGTHYYSLKDLDCGAATLNALGVTDRSTRSQDEVEASTSIPNNGVDNSRLVDNRFSVSESSVYFDGMSHIITKRLPLPLRGATSESRYNVTWSSLCSKNQITDVSSQQNLGMVMDEKAPHDDPANRFHQEKWIILNSETEEIVPGVRFYFEFADNYDLSGHPDCVYCKGKIIYNIAPCYTCKESFHEECTVPNDSGDRHCLMCLKGTREESQ